MPYQRAAAIVLADWRAVQRDLAAMRGARIADGALAIEIAALHATARRLRNEYHSLIRDTIGRCRHPSRATGRPSSWGRSGRPRHLGGLLSPIAVRRWSERMGDGMAVAGNR